MQIFEYSYKAGKGKKLGDVKYSGTGIRVGKHKSWNVFEHILLLTPEGETLNCTADDFATEAICCCFGKWEDKWEWAIIANKNMADKAKVRNDKLFGHKYWKEV